MVFLDPPPENLAPERRNWSRVVAVDDDLTKHSGHALHGIAATAGYRRRHGGTITMASSSRSHRFPLLMYSSIMAAMAAPMAMQSTFPLGLGILLVIVLLAALATAGYLIGREYVNGHWNGRDWN